MTATERAARLRLMLFDIDGVLTDGRLYFDAQGEALKVFHAHDGHGLKLLREAGLKVGVISARQSAAVQYRVNELKLDVVQLGAHNKLETLHQVLQHTGCSLEQTGFMGDDWVDLAVMRQVGFAATVANATSQMNSFAHWTSTRPGGQGAVRELAEFILQAQGQFTALFERHLNTGVAQG